MLSTVRSRRGLLALAAGAAPALSLLGRTAAQDSANSTSISISANGGTAIADASGGDDNTAVVVDKRRRRRRRRR
jgi:hypothetical protein